MNQALVEKKIQFFHDVIQKIILNVQRNKKLDILGISEVNACINVLNSISIKLKEVSDNLIIFTNENIINHLQNINNELVNLLKIYGTDSLEDLLTICFGNITSIIEEKDTSKFELLKKYFHPTSYKVIIKKEDEKIEKPDKSDKKKNQKKTTLDDFISDKISNLDCILCIDKNFHMKVYGIKLYIYHPTFNKNIIITGFLDDIIINFINNNTFINIKKQQLTDNLPNDENFHNESFHNYLTSLTLKEYLISSYSDIYSNYAGYVNQYKLLKQKSLAHISKEFINSDLYSKRNMIMLLLMQSVQYDNKYIAYLLYDMLSNDLNNATVDSKDQLVLYESFPYTIKQHFKDAMKQIIQYTAELSNFDINKIPLEQQICLLKTHDSVKEKAMTKLKEVKAKSEDSGSKARQYLDGLLKIPFQIYVKEPIMNLMNANREAFVQLIKDGQQGSQFTIPIKEKYTTLEIIKYSKQMKPDLNTYDKSVLLQIICKMNEYSKGNNKETTHKKKITNFASKNKTELVQLIAANNDVFEEVYSNKTVKKIEQNFQTITDYIKGVKTTLDEAVHGHDNAKQQIECIIAQWITGEQDGHCFGFEGSPGLGKCFAKNTPIMLSNGEIKMVQDITINDKLMGDDSTERNVLALGSGKEKMYRIEQIKGDHYIVNESHILSLKMTKSGTKGDNHKTILGKRYFKDDILDICIKDYLSLPIYIKESLKGYKVGIEFCEKPVSLEPYALGCWLGDGSSSSFRITNIDEPIIKYFEDLAKKYNLIIKQGTGRNSITYSLTIGKMGGRSDKNILVNKLKEYNLINNKHIPNQYKCNSRENRLQLLAGLIDTDGYYNKEGNALEITQKNKKLAEDILWIVRSLGFRGMMKECIKYCTYKGEKKYGTYYRTTITGKGLEDIPSLLERKKPREHKQIKNCLNTGINVVPLEEDEYFGFQIDGNSRFLLGDFTVTHNTTMAKRGLANCLKDSEGNSRPFAFIQMGGDSNGSTLHGHNYTYVGSTWGSIVQILMDKKCMNPIIFIDEIDKISRTEHGREIIGILTHLLDPTQNDSFQDKYFNGIDLDLSKALFILSYNDVTLLDKTMLDRIHRIKFNNLTLEEKLVISKTHILPEIYKKMGLENMIHFDDPVLSMIIEEYTSEPGVRKLKEILYEIVGEINIDILKNKNYDYDFLIQITEDNVKNKYFKDKYEVIHKKVHTENMVGIANGLWANSMGEGGVIPIQTKFYPASKFLDIKLTGMQGDVMKESMNVALTLAWNLTELEVREELITKYNKSSQQYGVHINTPEASVNKDGPSAGGCITTTIYSLLNNKKIKCNFAQTGEISLDGKITAIGGLDLKILGAIKSGVTDFIYPEENKKDFNKFYEKYKDNKLLIDIHFFPVTHISEVFELIFE